MLGEEIIYLRSRGRAPTKSLPWLGLEQISHAGVRGSMPSASSTAFVGLHQQEVEWGATPRQCALQQDESGIWHSQLQHIRGHMGEP